MNRSYLPPLLLLALTAAAAAGDKANSLTARQAAEGYLLLFDGETTMGWTSIDSSKWSIVDGALQVSKDRFGAIQSTASFHDYELTFDYKAGKDSEGQALTGVRDGKGGEAVLLPPADDWTRKTLNVKGKPGRIVLAGANISFRNITLKPVGGRSLFNHKDLTGWRVFLPEKYKSKFSVNEWGELNVQNGPGDIQTEEKFDDFLLQLECISNGKHLNSGIFFRCKPNEYQNGYEAQIRNQFTSEATQAYVVEVYDPKTHKLVEKRKVMSRAVDFGTGAIYRRVPARSRASKDGEWFTLTIAAHGNHFATWVNGIQQVDWRDNRPPHDNPRNGFRAQAGHISIQGHDPTTDLSFRNFRIVEVK